MQSSMFIKIKMTELIRLKSIRFYRINASLDRWIKFES